MRLLEPLESRTLLADTTGFAASASLLLDGRQSLDVQFTASLSAEPTLADIQLIDRSTGQPLSTGLSLSVSDDRKSIQLKPAGVWHDVKAMFGRQDYQVGDEGFDSMFEIHASAGEFASGTLLRSRSGSHARMS